MAINKLIFPVAAKKPAKGMISSLGMGIQALSNNIPRNTPVYPKKSIMLVIPVPIAPNIPSNFSPPFIYNFSESP
jgi:hypothetical protein